MSKLDTGLKNILIAFNNHYFKSEVKAFKPNKIDAIAISFIANEFDTDNYNQAEEYALQNHLINYISNTIKGS